MTSKTTQNSILSWIDMFGVGINMKINNNEYHKTKIGGCFSILLIVLMLIFAGNLFSQVLNKTSPTVLYQQLQISSPARHDIDATNFSLAFAILDENLSPYIDETIFTMTAEVFHSEVVIDAATGKSTSISGYEQITMERCTESHFQEPESRDYFLSLNYSNMYCIKPGQSGMYLQGQYSADIFNMIQVNVNECLDSINSNCKDSATRKIYLQKTDLQIYYMNSVVQLTDLDKPFQRVGQTQFWKTNYEMVQQVNLQFINTYVQDDMGLLYSEDLSIQTDMAFSAERTLQGSRDPSSDTSFYQVQLYMQKNVENVYKRTYMKVPQAFSQIGGIFNVLFALGCLFSKPYSRLQLNRKIINNTFSFDSDGESNSGRGKRKIKRSSQSKNTILSKQTSREMYLENSPNASPKLSSKFAGFERKNEIQKGGVTQIELTSNQKDKFQVKSVEEIIIRDFESNNLEKINSERAQKFEKELVNLEQNLEVRNQQFYNHENSNMPPQPQSPLSPENNKNQDNISNTEKKMMKDPKKEQQEDSFLKEMFDSVRIGTIDYFKSYISYLKCFQNETSKTLNYCTTKINHFTDVCTIINKQIELQHIKYLALSTDQLNLFKVIPKPKMNNQTMKVDPAISALFKGFETQQNPLLMEGNESQKKQAKIKDASAAYTNIIEMKSSENNINEKIIKMINTGDLVLSEEVIEQDNNINNNNNQSIILRNGNIFQNLASKRTQDSTPFGKTNKLINITLVENKMQSSSQILNYFMEDQQPSSPQRIYQSKEATIIPHHFSKISLSPQRRNLKNSNQIDQIESLQLSLTEPIQN